MAPVAFQKPDQVNHGGADHDSKSFERQVTSSLNYPNRGAREMGSVMGEEAKTASARRISAVSDGLARPKEKAGLRDIIDVSGERGGAFDDALLNCAVGERIIYHIGEHCAGAHRVAARKAYEKGLVTLSLKKRAKNRFEYIAIKIAEAV
ncbi:MAG: hypothetical protein HLUCCA05_13955 [Roseibaca calidilacus]|uniref:Uncharacterized protein n=2 Tax=Roseibaca calidilacus TaxID=1666912 RepID=A0A0P7YIF0_9RHOB|nr:MAG: hypothetical protein HLUCCA05_13955 [Roseibaca calidilacus]